MFRTVWHSKILRKTHLNMLQIMISKWRRARRCIQSIWFGKMHRNQVRFMNYWKLCLKKWVLMNYTNAWAIKNKSMSSEAWSAMLAPITSHFSAESSWNSTIKKLITKTKSKTYNRWEKKCRKIQNGLVLMTIESLQLKRTGLEYYSNVLNLLAIQLYCFMKS